MSMSVSRSMAWVLAVLLAAVAVPRPAGSAELKVDYGELAGIVRTLTQGAKVRIHNAPAEGLLFLVGGASSYVELASYQAPLDVPTEDGWAPIIGNYSYYVNNLDMTSLTVTEVPGAVRLSMAFDATGYKIVPSDDRLPSIAWDKPVVSLDLRPVKAGNSIALEAVRVDIKGTLKPQCTKKSVFCTYLALKQAKAKVKSMPAQISAQIKGAINSAAVRESFGKALESYLTLGNLGQVKIRAIRNGDKTATISFCLQGC